MLTHMCPTIAFNEVIERASHRLELTLPPAQVQSDQQVSYSVKLFNVLQCPQRERVGLWVLTVAMRNTDWLRIFWEASPSAVQQCEI